MKNIQEKLLEITMMNGNSGSKDDEKLENFEQGEINNVKEYTWHGYLLLSQDEFDYAETQFNDAIAHNYAPKQSEQKIFNNIKIKRKQKAKQEKEAKQQKAKQEKEAKQQKAKQEKEAKLTLQGYYNSLGLETNKDGQPTQNAGNYVALLSNKKYFNFDIKFNEFSELIELNGEPIKDSDLSLIANKFSDLAGFDSDRKIFNAITEIAYNNKYHPIKDYLESLVWDGTPRVETMFTRFLSAKDCKLYRMYAKLFMIAAIKRIYKPGCKFDNMLVLQGEQGNGKSTFCERLAVNDKWYNDNITIGDKDSLLYMQDAWIVIMDELDAWNKADTNAAKGFMSKRTDKFRAPYARCSEEHKRHNVFIGNTNDDTFLKDSTEISERRYWVIKTEGNWQTSRDKIKSMTPEVIDQLWAEAKYIYDDYPDIELIIPPSLYKDMIDDQQQFKNENGCEQFDFLDDILNKEYSDNVFDDITYLYLEYEGKRQLPPETQKSVKNVFPIKNLVYLFEKEHWFRKKNTFTFFAKWTHSAAWQSSKWTFKNAKLNKVVNKSLVRDVNDTTETLEQNNPFVKYTTENKYKVENPNKIDEVVKISGNDVF